MVQWDLGVLVHVASSDNMSGSGGNNVMQYKPSLLEVLNIKLASHIAPV